MTSSVFHDIPDQGKTQCSETPEFTYEGIQNILDQEGAVLMVEVPTGDKGRIHKGFTSVISRDRWAKEVDHILCITNSARMMYAMKQLRKGVHYSLSPTEAKDYILAVLRTQQTSKTFKGIKVLGTDQSFQVSEGKGVIPEGAVWHGMTVNNFADLDFANVRNILLKDKKDNGVAVLDKHRQNVGIDVGYVGNNNLYACKESHGVHRPNLHKGTDASWVRDGLVAATSLMQKHTSLLKTKYNWEFYGNCVDNKEMENRNDLCAALLVDSDRRNVVEGAKFIVQTQQINDPRKKASQVAVHWMPRMMHQILHQIPCDLPKTVLKNDNPLAAHSDGNNDPSPFHSPVIGISEWSAMIDDGKYYMVRTTLVVYSKHACQTYVRMRGNVDPLIKIIQKYYAEADPETFERPSYVPEGGKPKVISAPHVNKVGITYATFSESMREFVDHYGPTLGKAKCHIEGMPATSKLQVIVSAMLLSVTAIDHFPIVFRYLVLQIIRDPNYLGLDMAIDDPVAVGHAFYQKLFDSNFDAEVRKHFLAEYGWTTFKLRKQPSKGPKMEVTMFQRCILVSLRFRHHLHCIPEVELKKNLSFYYHRTLQILSGSPNNDSQDRRMLIDKFGVHGLPNMGELTTQHYIATAALIGYFPQIMASHAEIPSSLGASALFSTLPGWDNQVVEDGAYHLILSIVKALSLYFDCDASRIEELICKIKKIKQYADALEWVNSKHDVVCPGVPYLEFDHSGKVLRCYWDDEKIGIRLDCLDLRISDAEKQRFEAGSPLFWEAKLGEGEKHKKKKSGTKLATDPTSSFFPPALNRMKKNGFEITVCASHQPPGELQQPD